jgi:Flp pilus assembly protein TadG
MREETQRDSSACGVEQAWTPRKAESTRLRRRAQQESGQAAVEFALVVPFLCLLVLALFDFGKGVNYWLDAQHLANAGARLAAVAGDSTDPCQDGSGRTIQACIQQSAETKELRNGTGSVTSPAHVCISFPQGAQIGKPVNVTVTASYQWIPFIGGGTFHLKGDSTMRLERLPDYEPGCS